MQVLTIWQDRKMIQESLLQLQMERVATAKATVPPPTATARMPAVPSAGVAVPAPKAQSVVSLMLDGTQNVTANLENQYGTKGT